MALLESASGPEGPTPQRGLRPRGSSPCPPPARHCHGCVRFSGDDKQAMAGGRGRRVCDVGQVGPATADMPHWASVGRWILKTTVPDVSVSLG